MIDFPTHTKRLPQIWIEDDQYIIESPSFRYVISTVNKSKAKKSEPLKLLFKLCKRMKADAINQTYESIK
jgi:hypothetical protein